MVLCLLSRGSRGHWTKLDHEETVRGPEIVVKKVKFYSRSRKKVTVLNLFYKGAVNAYFLTGSFFKKTVVFEAAIFVGQPEDGAEVRCEVSRRVETAVSRYSGPSALRFLRCPARTPTPNLV